MFPYGFILLLILSIPSLVLHEYSKNKREMQMDELFFLSQEQGYCEAVSNYRLNQPAACQKEAQDARATNLQALKSEFNLQQSALPGKRDQ